MRRPWILMALVPAGLCATHASAAWPTLRTVFDPPILPQIGIAVAEVGGTSYFVGESCDERDTGTLNGAVHAKKYVVGSGFSARQEIYKDDMGNDRLTTAGERNLPAIALHGSSKLNVSMKVDASGFGPTLENPVVHLGGLGLLDNPPELVDDDSTLTPKRRHSSIAVNWDVSEVFACWTVDTGSQDDLYCSARSTSGSSWSGENIEAVATAAATEDHGSVVIQGTTSSTRVVAYHRAGVGIKVRLFDSSYNAQSPDDVELGVGPIDWPHVVDDSGTLHLVAWHTTNNTLHYAQCSSSCGDDGSWTTETIDDTGDAQHPQIALDSNGNVFVAYDHRPPMGDEDDVRVKITARCSGDLGMGNWANIPELVDNTDGKENVGGTEKNRAFPGLIYDAGNDRISVVYTQQTTSDRIGRWASKDATDAFDSLCP